MLERVQALRCAPALRAPAAAWTRPPRARVLAFIGATGKTELAYEEVGAMKRNSRALSTQRAGRLGRPPEAVGLQKRSARWPRTAEEVNEVYAGAVDTIRASMMEKQSTLTPGSANHAFLGKLLALPPDKLFEEVLKALYPNPERVGCPPYRVLMELGTRKRSLDDEWVEHITHCYPCSMELRRLVRAYMPPDAS